MTEKDKAISFDYAIYEIEEMIKCDIEVLESDWTTSPLSAYKRAKLNTYKEFLYALTKDEKWQLSLEELAKVIFDNE